MQLPGCERILVTCWAVVTHNRGLWQTDGPTDRQTDRQLLVATLVLCSALLRVRTSDNSKMLYISLSWLYSAENVSGRFWRSAL